MQQHPVPQNISSYEFRLVGDMTLKQFFQLAGGALVAFIIFKTNLPFLIKWPMVILSAVTGVLLAFVPVNGRPFSQWIMAFIKAVYSPTEFYWSSSPVVPEEPMAAIAPVAKTQTPLDKFEEQLFSRFTQLFSGQTPQIINTPPPIPQTIAVEPVVGIVGVAHTPETDVPPAPRVTQTLVSTMEQTQPPAPPISNIQYPITNNANVVPPSTVQPQVPSPISYPPSVQPARPTLIPVLDRSIKTPVVAPTLANLPLPSYPNILIGQVASPAGQIIEGVIIEIAEAESGIPVRALRSNKLGQFQIATPLPIGKYVIMAEKDGLTFDPIAILADNKIINPLLITAKA